MKTIIKIHTPTYEISLERKIQDAWIGAFWRENDLWICILPCFPFHIHKKLK
jgi:hypothetical protein